MSNETKEPSTPQTTTATAWLELPGGAKFSVQSACSIGRSSSNQVALKDEKISRCHALINARMENEYWLSDLGSSNGTYLNGGRLAQAVRIYDQDQIRIGHQILIFRQPTAGMRERTEPTMATMTLCDNKATPCWLLLGVFESPSQAGGSVTLADMPRLTEQWYDNSKAIIEEHGGILNKYLGNGYMAYWTDRDHTARSVAAAARRLKELQGQTPLRFRLVLHYGRVSINESARLGEGTLSGAEVSLAFRLEKLAVIFKVTCLASDSVQSRLKEFLPLDELGRTTAHGFDHDRLFYRF